MIPQVKRNMVIAWCLMAVLICACRNENKISPFSHGEDKHAFNDYYYGRNLDRIAFPVGGMGAGMFCLEGTGAISHMSVCNHPDIFHQPCMFAAITLKGIRESAKILEGPVPDWKKYGLPGSGYGQSFNESNLGLPRFEQARFLARFPFACIDLYDNDLPLKVQLKGWSPFIPADADNSSLPVGAVEYSIKNTGTTDIDAVFSYNSVNFMASVIPGKGSVKPVKNGYILSVEGRGDDLAQQGDFAIFTDDSTAIVDHCWFRSSFTESLTMVWKTISEGEVNSDPPVVDEPKDHLRSRGGSLFIPFSLKKGETKTIRIMMAWYVPHSNVRFGQDPIESPAQSSPANRDITESQYYQPWYVSRFNNITDVVDFWRNNYDELRRKTELFSTTFFDNTLPPEVVEALAANLSILKSPTLLRQPDGRLWCFEGCGDHTGCCEGSCTHVWNYAQAIPLLFPQLERTLRETEFFVNQDSLGHQLFRASLPIRIADHTRPFDPSFWAAADGQLGGIIKVYRDWRISGDHQWLNEIYPWVQQSMDFCISYWDPAKTGTIEEPHLNTYDVVFWGPNGMTTSIYLGALKAIGEMGRFLNKDVSGYDSIYLKGKECMETRLYNGEYFIQEIKWQGLRSPDPIEISQRTDPRKMAGSFWYSDEALEVFREEGPKHQYGNGCLSDGIIGCWMCEVAGLKNIIDPEKVKSHLSSVYRYNFKKNLKDHSNPARYTFALGQEGGLIVCTWPKGKPLSLPFEMSHEVWTGIEYQVASHLIFLGRLDEGLEIVRTCRNRYDGRIRNPFDEYECGHWYARALSSYALLQALTGVRYDAVDQTMYIDSKIGDFRSFISTGTGFGTIEVKNGRPVCTVVYGSIPVREFVMEKH